MKNLSIRQIKCLITLILAVFLCGAPAVAQTQKIAVKLDMTKVPMKTVMNEIEKQTKYLFLYTDEIDTKRIVSIKADSKPLNEVLPLLFKDTDITYEITVPNIVLSKRVAAARPSAISGVVKDSGGLGIIGATVLIKGTTVGTTTGIDGDFALTVPASVDNPELSVSFIGYETRVVPIGSRTTFDITLANSSIEVEQVVVTALGIKRAEKALSYNVQQVNSDAITANKDANFINSLNGKVAGVNINASSAGVGGASKVIMRGMKSISQTSNALYVIDGVPMFTKAQEGGTEFSSQGTTAPIADINPEDIESISVLTGAAAAALYGSDAANGAIVVTTKKGQAGQLSVTATAGVEIMTPFVLPEFQNRYGTGNLRVPDGAEHLSWGKALNSANKMGYDPRKDYFRTSTANSESFSLSAGTERNQTYFSAAAINSRGIVPNNSYDRYNFTFRNTTSFLNDKMRLDVGASYVLQEDCNMINQGTYNNPIVGAYLFPRGNDWEEIKMYEPAREPQGPLHAQCGALLRHPRLAECLGAYPRRQFAQHLHRESLRFDEHAADRIVGERPLRHYEKHGPPGLRRRPAQYQQDVRRRLVVAGQRRRLLLGHEERRHEDPRPHFRRQVGRKGRTGQRVQHPEPEQFDPDHPVAGGLARTDPVGLRIGRNRLQGYLLPDADGP